MDNLDEGKYYRHTYLGYIMQVEDICYDHEEVGEEYGEPQYLDYVIVSYRIVQAGKSYHKIGRSYETSIYEHDFDDEFEYVPEYSSKLWKAMHE